MKKTIIPLIIILASLITIFLVIKILNINFPPSNKKDEQSSTVLTPSQTPQIENISVVADNLEVPWEIVFLPDESLLVTERAGNLLRINQEKKVIAQIEGVDAIGEGGLLGLALHPDFKNNQLIYLYLTTLENGQLVNRVERYRLVNDQLKEKTIILDGIAANQFHDGGRIDFGPDGYLYVTTGDAQESQLSQDTSSLNGKILRIKDDGSIPTDNPFGNAVYSFGHRNSEGLTWDEQGRLWATEHGPSGTQTGYDEINLIVKGGNYGWPVIQGNEQRAGMISPVIQSGSNDTWAPAGIVYLKGSLFFTGLRGEALYEAVINPDNSLDLKVHLKNEFGRLRAIEIGPDGFLYLSTSNRDGRGEVKANDDKIIKINPDFLN